MLYLGIDENGYGPLMGPLIATGIAGTSDLESAWLKDISDSKKIFTKHDRIKTIEKISLSLFKIVFNKLPESVFELFEKTEDSKCSYGSICWEKMPEIPVNNFKDEIDNYTQYLYEFCEKKGISIKSIQSEVLCVKEFNQLCRKNLKKDYINFLQFKKIIEKNQDFHQEILVKAGKIGGRKNYQSFLKKTMSEWEIETAKEDFNISEYLLKKGINKIILRFVKDVEERSFLAVLAGIYGKYVRELIMTAINNSIGTKRFVSGYRDRFTAEFIKSFQEQNLPFKDCIIRIK